MEYILRFFALKSKEVKDLEKGIISLKKKLNEFMGSNNDDDHNEEFIEESKDNFEKVISFIYENIGENAFYNIISSNPKKIRKRFYPTIFDSISIATAIAQKELGDRIPIKNLEEKRLSLLQDKKFKDYITQGTMQVESIHGRISMVLESLYGVQYK